MQTVEREHGLEDQIRSDHLQRDNPKTANGKVAVFQFLVVGVFIFLISGFWKLQVQNPDVYSEAAAHNRIKSTPILAPRGKILDRDGRVIVDNKASYSLLLNRDQIKAAPEYKDSRDIVAIVTPKYLELPDAAPNASW